MSQQETDCHLMTIGIATRKSLGAISDLKLLELFTVYKYVELI